MSSSDDEQDVSGANIGGLNLESNDVQTTISEVVQYVITHSQKKIPVKKQNISKDCLRGKGRQFKYFLDEVNNNLDKYFGMKLIETPNKTTQYILVNTLGFVPYFDKSPEDHLMNGILIPVLAVIFMLKGEVKEDIIWNFLRTLGLDVENNRKLSPLNYTLKQLMTNIWVKQLYLEYYKLGENDEQYNVFNWGFRSEIEIDKKALLTYVSSIYDAHVSPETWHEQFALANNRINGQSVD